MSSNSFGLFGAAVLAASLTLCSCGLQPGERTAGAASPGAGASSTTGSVPTISPTAIPSPQADATTAIPSLDAPSLPGEPGQPAVETFTFPDGHISFTHPAGWTVKTKPGPALTPDAQAGSVEAVLVDGSGEEVARILSGMYGDGAAGPVKRTVLDQAPLAGISEAAGERVAFGFAVDQGLVQPPPYTAKPTLPADGGERYYFMGVRLADEFQPTFTSSGSPQVPLPNGVMEAAVIFDFEKQPVFASPDAAKAWMATEQYAQLKALLLSLTYS